MNARKFAMAVFVLFLVAVPRAALGAELNKIELIVSEKDLKEYGKRPEQPPTSPKVQRNPKPFEKYVFTGASIKVNDGQALKLEELSTHGQTSLSAKRKNFEVHLSDNENSKIQIEDITAKKLFLASMQADDGYISTAIGFKMYALAGIHTPRLKYVELYINGKSHGLYLAIERPVDVMKKELDSIFTARRRYFDKMEVKKYEADKTNLEQIEYEATLKSLYKARKKLSGEKLYNTWAEGFDINGYLTWLGLNSLMHNGDFSDEIYFFSRSNNIADGPIYFEIFPWDTDDLFKDKMHFHPINVVLSGFDKDSLLFNFESGLDRKINRDSYLYNKYQQVTYRILSTIVTDETIDAVIAETKAEIMPYLEIQSVLSNAKLDKGGEVYSKDYILGLLERRARFMKKQRASFMSRIKRALPDVEN